MNILRWKRKSKNKIRFKTIILFIFSLIMTTFAWFAYSKVLEPTLNIHMAAWDMEYYIGAKIPENKKTNPIAIDILTLYPTMPEQSVIVDIYNNGETLVDIDYQVKSVTIVGTTYEIVPEGGTNTTQNYISTASSVLGTNESGEQVYRGVITNDITKFPFTIEVEHSTQVEAVTEDAYGTSVPGEGYLKITVNWIGDNNELDSEWGYIVGEYFTNNPTATAAMSIVLSVDSYQADPDGGEIEEIFPSTLSTRPYLPEGFTKVPGTNLSTGLVITDGNGNEYVWVEVPRTTSVYTTAGINITEFTSDDANGAYSKIETDLRNYVSDYSTRADVHTNYDALGLSESNYTTLKQKMLKSIYSHGGFYIGRYETGTTTARTGAGATTGYTAVIKPNAYPYNYVTSSQAHSVSSGMAPTGYTSSLMFGIQWDLVMKYLETKGTSQEMLKTDSTSWGNYTNSAYSLTNENVKYMPENAWVSTIPYEKELDEQILITSGGNSGMCRQNIYDIAGNLSEWTYNLLYSNNYYVGGNGGDYLKNGDDTSATASSYGAYDSMSSFKEVGFRVALYSDATAATAWGDDGTGGSDTTDLPSTEYTTPYLPTGFSRVASTDLSNGLTIQDGSQNQYVWVEVPRNTTIYDEAGLSLDLDSLSGTELTNAYTAIEKDLHDYTETDYTDIHSGDDATTGLTSGAYTTLKQKMLKSVYENGGFYVGKYETGTIGTYRDYGTDFETEHPINETPVIQANAYPYGFVTAAQAQTLATGMASGEYTSSLMFDIQWDLVLKYLQSKGVSSTLLYNDSTSWGNYTDNTFSIADEDVSYNVLNIDTGALGEWTAATDYTHNVNDMALLTTGSKSDFSRMGIYDLAGNAYEWTLGYSLDSSDPCFFRGGGCYVEGSSFPASDSNSCPTGYSDGSIGFRVTLY